MKGTMIVMKVDGTTELFTYNGQKPALEELQKAVGGDAQIVPRFITIAYANTVMDCVVFCNEDGKVAKLPINECATMAWNMALKRQGGSLHDAESDKPKDWLVGDVAVVFGDREFMREV